MIKSCPDDLPAHDVSPLSRVESLGWQVEVLHAGAPLPVEEGQLGVGDGLPGHGGEEFDLERILVGPRMSLVALLRWQLFVITIKFPNLQKK